jgi:hypothetical protein
VICLLVLAAEMKKQTKEKFAVADEMMMNMYADHAVNAVPEEAKQVHSLSIHH